MFPARRVLSVCVLVVFLGAALWIGQSQTVSLEQAALGVYQLDLITLARGPESGGNGFVLCEPRLGVTAYHVATDEGWQPVTNMTVSQYGSRRRHTSIVYHDKDTDIAFWQPYDDMSCLPLGERLTVGDPLSYVTSMGIVRQVGYQRYTIVWSGPVWGQWGEVSEIGRNWNTLV